ncbi:MAG: hypothetical protein LUC85_03240 [Bacteroidales bacterium]|nr:hypothetical protein [Bacteroidales bacterium]
MTRPLLDFLQPNPQKSHSRWDAFHDLIMRAVSSPGHTVQFGQEFNLVPGEFVVTLTELANTWHWSRVTVRSFIKSLCDLGQLVVTSYTKCSVFDLVSLRFQWGEGAHPAGLLDDSSELKQIVDIASDNYGPHFIENFDNVTFGSDIDTPYIGEDGSALYTQEQRIEVLKMTSQVAAFLFRELLVRAYTPEVEKSMLDTYYGICGGSPDWFADVMKNALAASSHHLNVMGRGMLSDMREKAVELFSAASRELALKLPSASVCDDSEALKPIPII